MTSLVESRHGSDSGRNFGLKSGAPIQKKNDSPFGQETRWEENAEDVSFPPSDSGSERAPWALPAGSGRPKTVLL